MVYIPPGCPCCPFGPGRPGGPGMPLGPRISCTTTTRKYHSLPPTYTTAAYTIDSLSTKSSTHIFELKFTMHG